MRTSRVAGAEGTNQSRNSVRSPSVENVFTLPINELLIHLSTSYSGLTSKDARKLLEIYGYNELARRKKRAAIVELACVVCD